LTDDLFRQPEEEVCPLKEREYWNRVFARSDPWNYGGEYESRKFRHTLELMPDEPVGRAIEIGCAEGMFTELLAGQVGSLLAVDISEVALERARARCARMGNVSFAQHDIGQGMIGGDYDLVVCAEVLYYLPDHSAVERFARQVSDALCPGGQVLLTHGNMVSDDRATTGFDFHSIGAKTVAAIFDACPGMEFLRELRTELYRVQLFRRAADAQPRGTLEDVARGPREVSLRTCAEFQHPAIKWGGCAVTAAEARYCWVTTDVPVLMYHRVARDGPTELAPYRVAPDMFERQLAWLQRHGYHDLSADAFYQLWFAKKVRGIPGKPVVLTFDDAYADFYESAWPLLRRYGFTATVFVPTDYIGGSASWDSGYGPPARIMSWEQIIELHGQGIQFGSHGCRHKRLPELTGSEALDDCVESKRVLQDTLGTEIAGYCYPYAFADAMAKGLVEEAGYKFAVGGRGGKSPDRNNPFYIPRIEIFGGDTMDRFIDKLPAPSPADPSEQSRYRELLAKRARALYMGR
jgi:peptidoglycan/xylan/chitin deacetylase (PgdA/CDA1 family)/2-polyprenyl-3-methyl-5-hydroxy-6-metoxy-1,4-benzoquinol methylase